MLRAQGGERPPWCSPYGDIGIGLKPYDGVVARCPPPPLGCSRLDIHDVNELRLVLGPTWLETGRRPGCLTRGFQVLCQPTHPADCFRHAAECKGAIRNRAVHCFLDVIQLSIGVFSPKTEQVAAGS